ncbi:hypothetical protein OJAV_G00115670 [Oryzias javanicus]|uniref:Uncharacterized protein n=1 Tax=Oryzias javanicus TaxID=123683 RepID=A0A437CX49_ORYJA|nr:hypothetical protein OJAV_G00115670 [Oryzias javanicus]
MSKRRVEFKICQTISCSVPVSRSRRAPSPSAAAASMEDEERQKKLEAGKAKLAEYRQRKAHADSQKKQKKKKKKKDEDSGGDSQERGEDELERSVEGGGDKDPPAPQFSFSKTLRSGETVRHDHTYKIEPESEVSTTAEDYSSEVNGCCHEAPPRLAASADDVNREEVEYLEQLTEGQAPATMEDARAARTQAEEELTRELDDLKAAFGAEGVQQVSRSVRLRRRLCSSSII